MTRVILDGGRLVNAGDLDTEKLKALGEYSRRKILEKLAEEPSYPAKVSKELGIEKQKAYYHFEKLEEAGLIEPEREEKRSGGTAVYYRPSSDTYLLDLGTGGEKVFLPERTEEVREFLQPLVAGTSIDGKIVVGSPDQHGEDQVRARDGHLAGDIGLKLGSYAASSSITTWLDTRVKREEAFDDNLVLIGGVLTNTMAKKFNDYFPVNFSMDAFPYHGLETPENSYTGDGIGVVARTVNPLEDSKAVYLVAGIRNRGTEAAVRAFKNLEDILEGYTGGDFYCVVRGLDLDGDGEIDDYEVVEK